MGSTTFNENVSVYKHVIFIAHNTASFYCLIIILVLCFIAISCYTVRGPEKTETSQSRSIFQDFEIDLSRVIFFTLLDRAFSIILIILTPRSSRFG